MLRCLFGTHSVSRARRFGRIASLETAALIAGELEHIEAVSFGAEESPAECGCQALGVNLPMLIETVLSCDDESAIAVAQTALQAGQEGLVNLNELLPKPGSS
jgi:mannose/fructose-specific phosphotransferase system component IIA